MTYALTPILCQWTGETFTPQKRFARVCDRAFVIGEEYPLIVHENVSAASRGHFFACLTEAWRNLPEDRAEEFSTVEMLRKKALIRCGFADERSIVCASKAEAQRVGAFIRPMDEYAIVIVSECVVKVFTAKSQSLRAMGKQPFQASKTAVLDYVAGLCGVTTDDLKRNAGQSA